MKRTRTKWTNELLQEIALKYSMPKEFKNNDTKAYNAACDRGILQQITIHMVNGRYKKTNEELHNIALKYTERTKFAKGNP